jgi:arabinofuranan 3-O-arabinosyltransferase
VDAGSVRITLGDAPTTLSELRVRTETGVSAPVVAAAGETISVELPPGATTWLQVEDAEQRSGRQLSISELSVPGVRATRWLVPPTVEERWGSPDAISLSARADLRTGCAQVDESIRCRPGITDEGEEASGMRRLVTLPSPRTYEPRITVAPRPGEAVSRLLQQGRLVTVGASSRSTSGASVAGPVAALDGLPGTTWVSSWVDPAPTLNVAWLTRREVRGIELSLDPTAPARRPTRVTVSYPGGSQSVTIDDRGRAELDPVRTRSLSIRIDQASEGGNLDSDGTGSPLGVGVSELTINGVPFARIPVDAETTDYGCGSGPDLVVNDRVLETAVVGAPLDLHLGRPVPARVCGTETIELETGQNRIELGATDALRPVDLVLSDPASVAVPDTARPVVRSGGSAYATDGVSYVSLLHNVNHGWTATSGDATARPVTIDGWRQGFELADGASTLRTTFVPETAYRAGLVAGGVLLVGCCVLYVRWRRSGTNHPARPLGAGHVPAAAVVAGALLAGGLIGSSWGLAVTGAALVVLVPLARRHPQAAQTIGLAPLVVVGVWNSFHPWAGAGTWGGDYAFTHLALLVPLALLASTLLEPTRRRADDGRSTRR